MAPSLKRSLRTDDPVAGTWVSIGHPTVAELVAHVDYEFVVVDTEHTSTSLETVEHAVRAIEAAPGSTTSIVRTAWNDPVRIKRLLDTGVGGILVPMVESAEEAQAAVDAVRYPPDGSRGIAASRANAYGLDLAEAVPGANDDLVTIVQIETETAVDAAGEIAAVDGVDALLVGPADLSASLGVFGEWDDDRFSSAVDSILTAAAEADTRVGTLATSEAEIERWHAMGFDYLITGVDALQLLEGARGALECYESVRGARE